VAPDYEITEICIHGKLTAAAGFALVSKAGVEGAVIFTFTKTEKTSNPSS
jgi:hypothetical protein